MLIITGARDEAGGDPASLAKRIPGATVEHRCGSRFNDGTSRFHPARHHILGDLSWTTRSRQSLQSLLLNVPASTATARQTDLVTQQPRIIPELYTSDFERCLAFYVGVVGFTVLYRRQAERFAYLSLAGADLMIEQTVDPDGQLLAGELIHPFGRGVNLQISVDEIATLYERLCALSSPIFRALEERWYRQNDEEIGVHQFVAMDPDGYLLRFSESLGHRQVS